MGTIRRASAPFPRFVDALASTCTCSVSSLGQSTVVFEIRLHRYEPHSWASQELQAGVLGSSPPFTPHNNPVR